MITRIFLGLALLTLSATAVRAQWNVNAVSLPMNNAYAVALAPDGTGIASGSDGIVRTTDFGLTWSTVTTPFTVFWFGAERIDPTTYLVCGEAGRMLRSSDGGITWQEQTTGATNDLACVAGVDANLVFASGNKGTALKSTDGGRTWNALTTGITAERLNSIAFATPLVGVAVGGTVDPSGGTGIAVRTTDGGAQWTPVAIASAPYLSGVRFFDAFNGVACAFNGRIYWTSDAGATWNAASTPSTWNLNGLDVTTAGTVFVVSEVGYILRSTDMGRSWGFLASGTTEVLNAVSFADEQHGAAVGSFGACVTTANGGVPIVSAEPPARCATFALAQNYPNPFTSATIIPFTLTQRADVTLAVFDQFGRRVAVPASGVMDAGAHFATFDAARLAAGTYTLELRANGAVTRRRCGKH